MIDLIIVITLYTKNEEKFYTPSSIFSINIYNICFFIILTD